MRSELYLDTARLGRMCTGARKAEQDFCWLVSQLGSSLYLEQFLSVGYDALPQRFQRRHKGLRCWRGLGGFSDLVRQSVNAPAEAPVLFFGQSSSLIEFAVDGLLRACSKIMVTDLCWPPYLETLKRMAASDGKAVSVVSLSKLIVEGITAQQVCDIIRRQYALHQCDGLFVSDISYQGYRLPAKRLISSLNPIFSVVDGAQAIGQRPVDLSSMNCDLYLAGTQKWLGTYHPLRVGISGRASTAENVKYNATNFSSKSADGLFRFSEQLRTSNFPPFGTTVNVIPLIAAAGALDGSLSRREATICWKVMRQNAYRVLDWAESSGWSGVRVDQSLRSGIVRLLQRKPKSSNPMRVREKLAQNSVVASAYEDGSIRMSMPPWHLSIQQLSMVRRAIEELQRTRVECSENPNEPC